MREYVIIKSAKVWDDEPDAEDYLARTVFEQEELIDTGVLDVAGNKIMAREKRTPIGYVLFDHK